MTIDKIVFGSMAILMLAIILSPIALFIASTVSKLFKDKDYHKHWEL